MARDGKHRLVLTRVSFDVAWKEDESAVAHEIVKRLIEFGAIWAEDAINVEHAEGIIAFAIREDRDSTRIEMEAQDAREGD